MAEGKSIYMGETAYREVIFIGIKDTAVLKGQEGEPSEREANGKGNPRVWV